MLMRHFMVAVLAAALLLTGCTAHSTPPAASHAPPTTIPPVSGTSTAIGLVGLWRVSDTAGERPYTWLRLDANEFQLWRECGMVMGSWSAGESVFVASVFGADGACVEGRVPSLDWLESATSYERDGEGWTLTDDDGAAVARLAIDGAPEPIETAAEFYTRPPELTGETLAAFRRPAPLPPNIAAATPEQLVGRWEPIGSTGTTDPHVEFAIDGSWLGSDGCNGGGGRWAVGPDGQFFATSGPTTLMGCDGAFVPSWVATARLAGFDGTRLLLLDQEGREIGRLVRG
ncbi:hypothetical protein ASD23_08720 [Agromyces sp. Root1464]|nr:hypothetical protein ASD23_08720 [Agromyces sp. Root1464]